MDAGTYVTNGTDSPAVYCTADISVANASLTANASMIYQSMSGDAAIGEASFSAEGGSAYTGSINSDKEAIKAGILKIEGIAKYVFASIVCARMECIGHWNGFATPSSKITFYIPIITYPEKICESCRLKVSSDYMFEQSNNSINREEIASRFVRFIYGTIFSVFSKFYSIFPLEFYLILVQYLYQINNIIIHENLLLKYLFLSIVKNT